MRRTLIAIATGGLVLAACGTDGETPGTDETTTPPATTSPATAPATPTDDGDDDASPTATSSPTAASSPDGTASPTTTATATPDEPSSPADVGAMTFTECESDRYTVGYPAEWETNDPGGIMGPCAVFHPDEIDEPEQARDRDLHYAVSMYVDAVEYDEARDSDAGEVIEERETTVDGHQAVVEEIRSSGEALVPEGELRYAYTVDLDGEILVAVTYSVGETDYERDKRVLDRMVTEELTIEPAG